MALDRICAFLGVESGLIGEIPRENVTGHPERTLSHQAVAVGMRASDAAGLLLPGNHRGGRDSAASSDSCSAAAASGSRWTGGSARPCCRPSRQDIRLLGEVLDEDFSDWLAPRDRSGNMVGNRPPGHGQARNGRVRPSGTE